jgi:endonuclease/exonuclease/phosphatase family metal-dependent hydrolase
MALAKKRELLYKLHPDIAVIPECSRDSMLVCQDDGFDTCWWGENRHKGLGVIAARPWTLESKRRMPAQRWIAPVWVRGPRDFLLLPVWACPVGALREKNYVGQTYEAIVRHPQWFKADCPTVICGDFNSNPIFDPGRKKRTHSNVVRLLAERGLHSAYHEHFSETHGSESMPTYYFWHRKERSFHIDYIFVPKSWIERIADFRVGSFNEWRRASDHVPIVVDIAEGDPIPSVKPTG